MTVCLYFVQNYKMAQESVTIYFFQLDHVCLEHFFILKETMPFYYTIQCRVFKNISWRIVVRKKSSMEEVIKCLCQISDENVLYIIFHLQRNWHPRNRKRVEEFLLWVHPLKTFVMTSSDMFNFSQSDKVCHLQWSQGLIE